jgi:hypothetical protein
LCALNPLRFLRVLCASAVNYYPLYVQVIIDIKGPTGVTRNES